MDKTVRIDEEVWKETLAIRKKALGIDMCFISDKDRAYIFLKSAQNYYEQIIKSVER